MADLLISNVDPELKRQLEARAQTHQRTLSEEAEILLRSGLASALPRRKLGTEMANLIRPEDRGDDLVFEVRGQMRPPPDFE